MSAYWEHSQVHSQGIFFFDFWFIIPYPNMLRWSRCLSYGQGVFMVSCTHTEIYNNDNNKHLDRCWHGFTFVPSDPFITFVHTSPSVISPQRADNHVSLLKYNQRVFIYQGQMLWDFPGVPGVKNLPSCAGGMG